MRKFKKTFSKFMAFMFAVINTLCVSVNANPLPRSYFKVYKVAVIGSDIKEGIPIEQEPGYNKRIINYLCNVGTKLEDFDDIHDYCIDVDDNNIKIGDEILPKTSMLVESQNRMFCFYDINTYGPSIINECPYAIYPYILDTKEPLPDIENRMIRLRDYVKESNDMCDIKFLCIDETCNDESTSYFHDLINVVDRKVDIYEYQQTVNTERIRDNSFRADCERFIGGFWDREEEFKKRWGKTFPGFNFGTDGWKQENVHISPEPKVASPEVTPSEITPEEKKTTNLCPLVFIGGIFLATVTPLLIKNALKTLRATNASKST